MKSFRQMSEGEFRQTVQTLATEAGLRWYQRQNPTCSDDQAGRYALRNWRQHVDVAFDILANIEALNENEAAPNN